MSTAQNLNASHLDHIESLEDRISKLKEVARIEGGKVIETESTETVKAVHQDYKQAAMELWQLNESVKNGSVELSDLETMALEQAMNLMQAVKSDIGKRLNDLMANNNVDVNANEPLNEQQEKEFNLLKAYIQRMNANPVKQQLIREAILDFGCVTEGRGKRKRRVTTHIRHSHPKKQELWTEYYCQIFKIVNDQIGDLESKVSNENASENEIAKLETLRRVLDEKEAALISKGIDPSELV